MSGIGQRLRVAFVTSARAPQMPKVALNVEDGDVPHELGTAALHKQADSKCVPLRINVAVVGRQRYVGVHGFTSGQFEPLDLKS